MSDPGNAAARAGGEAAPVTADAPPPARVPVLIVGGSIVGASAALFLAARGITPVLVEKHTAVSTRPRAKLFYPRTMEAYRSVGADQDVYAVQRRLPPADHAAVVASLAGPELRRWRLPAAEDFSGVSPCPSAFVKQADLEEVVRAHARAAGADLRFGHRLLRLRRHEDHVEAQVRRADGSTYTATADYLLAADGNGSAVRESLGIGRSGTEVVAHIMEIGFEADLRRLLEGRRLALAFTGPPEQAFLSWNTAQDRGTVSVTYDPALTDPAAFDARRCGGIVSRALGLPPSRFTLTGSRPWQMGAWVADSYRAGRVFLLGDAVHVTPPTGGFGANTGIQDAWNLTAKLVSVLRGHAGPRLLEDYEPERRVVGRITVEQALLRARHRARVPDDRPLLSEAAVAIGYRYPMPGADPADGGPAMADEPDRRRGEPGTRLPHLPLTGRDGPGSTLDLVREGRYLLLSGPEGHAWVRAARRLDPHGAFLDTALLPHRIASAATRPAGACGIGDHGALLIRPDHVIAWRAPDAAPDPLTALAAATRRARGFDRSGRAEAG
ncbi:FAD-dependent monooxygenase [Actinoallomurus rhizosphaericola]|uniref:FAD-dependent monooxygenase n=1 Tax=Actinoallomurus rhizosphaericola TaxID=2952536 RepID=UPI002093F4EE|nr:FAD-dependent monooxygenase [Actinoallomurus rhizosphaericola]MCO5997356.1 FAD-dependent monooxygenase [Actinoallomurus rhizosphaericola]